MPRLRSVQAQALAGWTIVVVGYVVWSRLGSPLDRAGNSWTIATAAAATKQPLKKQ